MISAYSELYLTDARKTLGSMFDYAVNDCGFDADEFSAFFVMSGRARQFETGSPAVIGGMSGVELAKKVMEYACPEGPDTPAKQPTDRSPEYWAGWALAYWQWASLYRFSDIFEKVKMSEIIGMYKIYHESDVALFCEEMDRRMNERSTVTKLKRIREARGLSQSELSALSGVGLRSIQMYEQRKNEIDRAQGQILYKLSVVLGCRIEDILEQPNK